MVNCVCGMNSAAFVFAYILRSFIVVCRCVAIATWIIYNWVRICCMHNNDVHCVLFRQNSKIITRINLFCPPFPHSSLEFTSHRFHLQTTFHIQIGVTKEFNFSTFEFHVTSVHCSVHFIMHAICSKCFPSHKQQQQSGMNSEVKCSFFLLCSGMTITWFYDGTIQPQHNVYGIQAIK